MNERYINYAQTYSDSYQNLSENGMEHQNLRYVQVDTIPSCQELNSNKKFFKIQPKSEKTYQKKIDHNQDAYTDWDVTKTHAIQNARIIFTNTNTH